MNRAPVALVGHVRRSWLRRATGRLQVDGYVDNVQGAGAAATTTGASSAATGVEARFVAEVRRTRRSDICSHDRRRR